MTFPAGDEKDGMDANDDKGDIDSGGGAASAEPGCNTNITGEDDCIVEAG